MGWISAERLRALGQCMAKNESGQYLIRLADNPETL
jgi:hypothetical protein